MCAKKTVIHITPPINYTPTVNAILPTHPKESQKLSKMCFHDWNEQQKRETIDEYTGWHKT